VNSRHNRNTEINRTARHPHLEPPILGNALFGDVQLGNNLDPADDRRVMAFVDGLHRLVEDTIDPVLDNNLTLLCFDVDVRGAALDGVEQERIDQPNDRTLVRRDAVDRQHLRSCRTAPAC